MPQKSPSRISRIQINSTFLWVSGRRKVGKIKALHEQLLVLRCKPLPADSVQLCEVLFWVLWKSEFGSKTTCIRANLCKLSNIAQQLCILHLVIWKRPESVPLESGTCMHNKTCSLHFSCRTHQGALKKTKGTKQCQGQAEGPFSAREKVCYQSQ